MFARILQLYLKLIHLYVMDHVFSAALWRPKARNIIIFIHELDLAYLYLFLSGVSHRRHQYYFIFLVRGLLNVFLDNLNLFNGISIFAIHVSFKCIRFFLSLKVLEFPAYGSQVIKLGIVLLR